MENESWSNGPASIHQLKQFPVSFSSAFCFVIMLACWHIKDGKYICSAIILKVPARHPA